MDVLDIIHGPIYYILSNLDPRLKLLEVKGHNRFFTNDFFQNCRRESRKKLQCCLFSFLNSEHNYGV